MAQEEVEKLPSASRRYAIMVVMFFILAGIIFKFGFLSKNFRVITTRRKKIFKLTKKRKSSTKCFYIILRKVSQFFRKCIHILSNKINITSEMPMVLEEVKGRERAFVIDTIVTWADMIIFGMQFGGLEGLAAVAQTQKAEILEALAQIPDTTTLEIGRASCRERV